AVGRDHDRGRGEVLGVDRAGQRVVVDDVGALGGGGVVGGDHVVELHVGPAGADADGAREDRPSPDGASAVAGRPQQDVVAGLGQAAGQRVDDPLGPAVGGGRDGQPGGRDEDDPHG